MKPAGSDPRPPAVVELLQTYAPALVPAGWPQWLDPAADRSDADRPALTVIVRTQGARCELLEEALTCLAGQTCPDFEVLLAVHDAAEPDRAAVAEQLARFDGLLGRAARLVPVHGGGRARPITVALAQARGRHVTVLDDDDHVLAHWVETYARLARQRPEALLRVGAATRWVRTVPGPGGPVRVAASALEPTYVEPWDFVAHLDLNRTPVHAFAFPRYAVERLGIHWDDEQPVVEDWTFLLRCAQACGVAEDLTVAAVYNRSLRGSTQAQIAPQVWAEVEEGVQAWLRSTPAPMRPPSARPRHERAGPFPAGAEEPDRGSVRYLVTATRWVWATEGTRGVLSRVPRVARRTVARTKARIRDPGRSYR